jgi:hypothetical protein
MCLDTDCSVVGCVNLLDLSRNWLFCCRVCELAGLVVLVSQELDRAATHQEVSGHHGRYDRSPSARGPGLPPDLVAVWRPQSVACWDGSTRSGVVQVRFCCHLLIWCSYCLTIYQQALKSTLPFLHWLNVHSMFIHCGHGKVSCCKDCIPRMVWQGQGHVIPEAVLIRATRSIDTFRILKFYLFVYNHCCNFSFIFFLSSKFSR